MAGLNLIGLMVMAAVTGIFYVRIDMAGLAFDRPLATMVQREIMHRHAGRRPGVYGVAVLALHPKEAGVDFWFGMAFHTQLWRAVKDLIRMALFAFQISVSTVEREKTGMIEIAHPVNAIVAIQASRPELSLVLGHKGRLIGALRMAGNTGVQIKLPDVVLMAVFTHELAAIFLLQMAGQAETGRPSVIEGLSIPDGRRPT